MDSFFGFMFMQTTPIARFELPDVFGRKGLIVDTCGNVTDSLHEYETAVSHPSYNNGKWIIVEECDTKEEAISNHNKWVEIMTKDSLPTILKDVSTSQAACLLEEINGNSFRNKNYTIDITSDELKLLD